MKNIMLIYPPGKLYQRGEDRCQLNINQSSVNDIRPCNDLGYASAILKEKNYKIFLKDYQTEKLSVQDLLNDIKIFIPQVVFISTTNATILDDLEIVNQIKSNYPNIAIILKGAIFCNCQPEIFENIDFKNVDYMIGGEVEFIIGELIDSHFNNKINLEKIQGIIYKNNEKFIINPYNVFNADLDSLPFPDRSEMKNELYTMPDTGECMATIATSRGCPSSCIFCLTPIISGKKIRFRSTQNIFDEINECYYKYNISNFFFKADTFTINKEWTIDLCKKIINSSLYNKIRWAANSRVDTVDEELLGYMKKAGCFLIAFGLETGTDESLKKMKKNTSLIQNYNSVQMAKKAGLQTLGFYIIGFPWETKNDLEKTKKAIFKNDTDFIEIHIAVPFIGTELYNEFYLDEHINNKIYGKNHFNYINTIKNKNLNSKYVEQFRKNTVLQYYTRPKYIICKIKQSLKRPKILLNYLKYGLRLIKNTIGIK